MDYNQLFENNHNPNFHSYEADFDKVVYNQSFQPLVVSDSEFAEERPVPVYYSNTEVLPFRECLLMLIVQFIPIVGLVMSAIWSFEGQGITPKKILSRAILACHGILCVALTLLNIFGGISII